MARVLVSRSTSIFKNIAFEDHLFSCTTLPTLYLWQNDRTIVIGRHQNPWKEVHMDRMEEDGVQLCRRKSGGGAVYEDLGNSVFTFITPSASNVDCKVLNNHLLLTTLKTLGVEAEASGRNDLMSKGKKISGSAYKMMTKGGQTLSLHHGTMLIDIDKEGIAKYLNPNKAKLLSKGITSVSSRVMNLTEAVPGLSHAVFCNALIHSFRQQYGLQVPIEEVTDLPPEAQELAQWYQSWEWRYGNCPSFSNHLETRFEWGIIDITLDVEDACIARAKVYSDCLYPDFIDLLTATLQGLKYGHEGLEQLSMVLREGFPNLSGYVSDLTEWLRTSM
jgi:lipoate-protein ligase A